MTNTALLLKIGFWLPEHKSLSLLFKATRDGFRASDFHKNCDNKGATLVVVKAIGSETIFGGYTGIPWKSSGNFSKV